MEVRPILSAMMRNRTGAVLVALQIAFTLAIVVNSVFIIGERIKKMNRPTGIDVENIITVYSRGIGEDFNKQQSVREDLEALRVLPGVVAVTSAQHVPLSGSGWGSGLRPMPGGQETDDVGAARYNVSTQAVEAFGVKLESGRAFREDEIVFRENHGDPREVVIITRAMADKLFPDGTAGPGTVVYDGLNRPITIIGIIEQMHGAWVNWDKLDQVMLYPEVSDSPSTYYLIRTEPGERDRVMPLVEETLVGLNDRRVVERLRTLSDIKDRSYRGDRAMAILLGTVIGLLIAITALGIVGLASYIIKQRTKQIGTRRAIGARKIDIIRYFLVENWLMTTMGVIVGTALTLGLNYWLVTEFELTRLDLLYVPAGIFVLWGLGLLAVLGPARRAAAIEPAIATRTV